jgi:hypothetical protein
MAEQTDTAKDDGLLDVTALVEMFEQAEDASLSARKEAERDRDYCDNIQYTAEELAAFAKRKQPPIVINRVKRKVDFLKGYEQSQRVNPKVLPRTLAHEQDADGAEKSLIYAAEKERFDHKRSGVWDNLLVEGTGGYDVGVKKGYDGQIDVTISRVPWDRMFYDPHSAEPDFSDAGYLGLVRWVDFNEAKLEYPEGVDSLEWTINDTTPSDTYDDKPKFRVWADKKRKRVRICQIWVKRGKDWFFAEFTKGGILKAGPSPYVTDKGESDCGLIFGSAYVNRDNDRYGIVREMIGPQDEINKRRSKALHLLNTNQMVYERGAVQDVEKARREAARPDGAIELNPGGFETFKLETRLDLATAQMSLLQEAKNEIDQMAGNIALQGNALNQNSASGKAIIASQQGGAMEIAPILDKLRDMDLRVFRAVWYRIRQFWTAEKWVRITDDERNVKWVGLNVDPQQVQMALMQNPEMQGKIAGVVPQLAELDCDIIIDDAPDGITPQIEQFQALVELKKMDANGELPFRAIMAAMPNLRNKQEILAQMDESAQGAQQSNAQMAQLNMAANQAKVQETQASAQLKQAQAFKAVQEAQQPPDMPQGPEQTPYAEQLAQFNESQANVVDTYASADLKRAQTAKTLEEMRLMPHKMAQDAQMKHDQMMQRASMAKRAV